MDPTTDIDLQVRSLAATVCWYHGRTDTALRPRRFLLVYWPDYNGRFHDGSGWSAWFPAQRNRDCDEILAIAEVS